MMKRKEAQGEEGGENRRASERCVTKGSYERKESSRGALVDHVGIGRCATYW